MPIIGNVGRRSTKVRALDGLIHLLLVLGAITMIYPFLLMVSGSFKSNVDSREFNIWPRYFNDDAMLFRKYVEARYNERTALLKTCYLQKFDSFDEVAPPAQPVAKRAEDWLRFLRETGDRHGSYDYVTAEQAGIGVYPRNNRAFALELKKETDGELGSLNEKYGTSLLTWDELNSSMVLYSSILSRRYSGETDGILKRFSEFAKALPLQHRIYPSMDGDYIQRELKPAYASDLMALNAALGTDYLSWDGIRLSQSRPKGKDEKHWARYVKTMVNASKIRLTDAATISYRDFLKRQHDSIEQLNSVYGTTHGSFEDVPLAEQMPTPGVARNDWLVFLEDEADPDHIRLQGVDFQYRSWLQGEYDHVDALNQAHGTEWYSFDDVVVDALHSDWHALTENASEIRREFITRNYAMVLSVMLYNGRAMLNTLIYCLLAITTALIVNPLGAYAMSRFRLPTTYKILLFLMLTMAFPPMVMGIPNFLMLKRLGLLNTFWALVLPVAANGYFIFLLKGFFDSLPRELFECATLDGASEWQIFWKIAMSLSKPIMAVIALNAFNNAYRDFMFAFIVCQDQSMWTMMVHIYQLMQRSSQSVGFAALVLAAIPVFAVFIFCQKIIIRGIVVPTEK